MSSHVMSIVKKELCGKLRGQITAFNEALGGDMLFGCFEDEKKFYEQLFAVSSSLTISRGQPAGKPDPVHAPSADDTVTMQAGLAFELGHDSSKDTI